MSLAPAYRIVKASDRVEFVPGQAPELHLNASYTLENYGTSVSPFIDVILPGGTRYGMRNLLVKVNGNTVSSVQLSLWSQEEQTKFRVPFEPAWNPKERRDLAVEYTFSTHEGAETRVGLQASSFYLISPGWLPVLEPPTHVLSSPPASPDRTAYSIEVPADYLVLASGKLLGRKRNGGTSEYRFELRKNDPAPYIVAGRYVDSCLNDPKCGVSFWTLKPLQRDRAPAQEQIASAWNILEKTFGPLQKNNLIPHIVESPGLHHINYVVPSAAPFFGGVLVNSQAISLGVYSRDFLDLVTHALAGNWFAVQIYPPNSLVGISEGLSDYAVIVIDEARHGDAARTERVTRFLLEYDDACKEAVERPIVSTTTRDPIEQRRIALAKVPLFFIALEDANGEEPVRRGLAQVVTLLRGQEVGYQDLRAAIENVTGKDLAPIFRTWLYKPGIPAEFREKYPDVAGKH